ncbi:MAG: helix-turn-helix transcriptional regulator [Lentisphaeria bacterium]|nr:helix-turn-helix transcriptional regulator [Lentisphaeria bacterium]
MNNGFETEASELPELLFARKVAYAPCYSNNWHAIKEHQIFHILRGNMTLELRSGLCYRAFPGDTLFLPAGVRHRDRFHEPNGPEMIHLRFRWNGAERFAPDCVQHFPPSARADIAAVFHLLHLPKMRMDGKFDSPFQHRRVALQLGVILAICQEQLSAPGREIADPDADRFGEACRYIEDRLESRLTLASVSSRLRISPRTLSRLFAKFAGMSFHAYLLSRRMKKAREMLETGGRSLSETAYALGFSDPGYFGKVFKKYFSVSPARLR